MNTPLLSIIIPVYNVSPYIGECLDSLQAQTFRDFEALLVDDGSTDGSGLICDRYAAADSRFKVIRKTNGGVSSARNAALDKCTGKYLTMLDPDDSVSPDTYENIRYLEAHPDTDILQFPYINCYENGRQEKLEVRPQLIEGKDRILLNWWEGNILHFANLNKIFRRTVFEGLRYREGHVSEDTYLVADFVERVNRVCISGQGRYYYRIRNNSLTSAYTFPKHIDLFEAHLRTYAKMTEYPLLRPARVTAFTRLFRRLISARLSSPQTDIHPYLTAVKPYVPRWSDITAHPTAWIIALKILGPKRFMHLLCRRIQKNGKN